MSHAPNMNLGDRPVLPMYPAPMSSLPQPLIGPARWEQTRAIAAALLLVAAVFVVLGSFLPLFVGASTFGDRTSSMTATAWGFDVSDGDPFGDLPTNGYPLAFGAIALFCAAGLTGAAAMPSVTPGTRRLAGTAAAVAAAFLTGTVWTIVLQAVSWVDSFDSVDATAVDNVDSFGATASYGAGFWLLVVALLLALLAAVMALLPTRNRPWQPERLAPDNSTVATPPFGIAIPVALPSQPTYAPPPMPAQPVVDPTPPPPPPAPEPPPLLPITGTEDPLAPPPGEESKP